MRHGRRDVNSQGIQPGSRSASLGQRAGRTGRVVLVVAVGAVVALGAFLLLQTVRNDRAGTEPTQPPVWNTQTAAQFSRSIEQPDMLVVNVHVPFEGDIAGTDLNIAYDQITEDPRLPENLDAPIALYCQSGRMSTTAARALVANGRPNIIELDGGMNAWQQSGRPLVGEG